MPCPAPPPGTPPRDNEAQPSSRHQDPGPEHASYVFLLDAAGGIHPLPHAKYVALAGGEGEAPAFAGQAFRLADWYVRLQDGAPHRVVNEWYGWVRFDSTGRFEPSPEGAGQDPSTPGSRNIDTSALPTAQERERMEAILFG